MLVLINLYSHIWQSQKPTQNGHAMFMFVRFTDHGGFQTPLDFSNLRSSSFYPGYALNVDVKYANKFILICRSGILSSDYPTKVDVKYANQIILDSPSRQTIGHM